MPRTARMHAPGQLFHVISRFTDHRFELNDDLREHALEAAARALRSTDWTLLAYALMSNHIHWVLTAGEEPSCAWTRRLNTAVARAIQAARRARGRALGAVFGDRPREVVVVARAASRLIAYVHNNPVRAGVAERATDSAWTSHRALVGIDAPCSALDVAAALRACSLTNDDRGRRELATIVDRERGAPTVALPRARAASERARARTFLKLPVELGGAVVTDAGVLRDVLVHPTMPRVGPPRPPRAIIEAAARAVGVPWEIAVSRSRARPAVDARRLAMLAGRLAGNTNVDMARALGIGASAAGELVDAAGHRPGWVERARAVVAELDAAASAAAAQRRRAPRGARRAAYRG